MLWGEIRYSVKANGNFPSAAMEQPLISALKQRDNAIVFLTWIGLHTLGRHEETKQAMCRVSDLHATTLADQKKSLVDAHVVGTR